MRYAAALTLTLALAFSPLPVRADAPAPSTTPAPAATHLVITDVNGQMSVMSAAWHRLIIMGPDENAHPAETTNTTYAIVDTQGYHLVGRAHTDGTIGVAGIDEQRGLLYLAVSTLPTRVTGSGTSYHDLLWIVDLRSGRLLGERLFYEGEPETLAGLTIDPTSGHVFVIAVRGGSGTYELMMIDPRTMSTTIDALNGLPALIFDDAPHHRVVVNEAVGNGDAAVSTLVAFDSQTAHPLWTHPLQYAELRFLSASYQATGVIYDPLRLQAWILAPGGLVTRLAIGSGSVDRTIPLGYSRSDAWAQTGTFAIDMPRGRSYAGWKDNVGCHIDRTDTQAMRRDFVDYTGQCGQANASFLSVNPYTGDIIAADTATLYIFSGATGHLRHSYSLLNDKGVGSTWVTSATLSDHGHCSIALIGDVRHQNDATGSLSAGAAVIIPIS